MLTCVPIQLITALLLVLFKKITMLIFTSDILKNINIVKILTTTSIAISIFLKHKTYISEKHIQRRC